MDELTKGVQEEVVQYTMFEDVGVLVDENTIILEGKLERWQHPYWRKMN